MNEAAVADPLDFLAQAHEAQFQLCAMLERIADDLPGRIDRQMCFNASMLLRSELAFHQADEELGLFPLLHAKCDDVPELRGSMQRLEREHVDDEGFADEIIEALEKFVRGEPLLDVETFAYMLRGFFESFRRHIAFEDEVIIPAARRYLSQTDKEKLVAVILKNRSADMTRLFPSTACISAKAAILRALGSKVETEEIPNSRRSPQSGVADQEPTPDGRQSVQ